MKTDKPSIPDFPPLALGALLRPIEDDDILAEMLADDPDLDERGASSGSKVTFTSPPD